jgi:hypothetical protein
MKLSRKVDAMNALISVIRRTSVPVVVILTLLIAAANAQPADSSGCTIPAMPSYSSLTSDTTLPDPFKFMDGTEMTRLNQWPCRRAEIAALAQEFEYGYKSYTPYSATTGSMSGNTLTVTVTDSGKTISFSCPITYPSTGSAPYPTMIGCGFSSLNNTALSNMGVAVITFPSDQIAQETDAGSRGKGLFYDLYGSNQSAGALMAWAWGADRLIDAIEKTPAANLDPKRLGVTGCSRWGKGALAIGAFDERIVLTIPQESGSGGAACWRVSDDMFAKGQVTQTLHEITGENCWFRQNFSQFNNTSDRLPFDQHSIIGLVAPRAILIIENDILWLGPYSSWICANAAERIWQGLKVFYKMGFTQSTAHNHCAFPSSEQPAVDEFVKKYLVGNNLGNTYDFGSDIGFVFDVSAQTRWVPWSSPILSSVGEQGQQSTLPTGFYLEQNYPNPFNPSTTISFGIPKNTFVSLKVCNSSGQEIAELAGKEYSAGRHTVTFNASTLASGVYFCAMKAGDFSTVEKMTLLK